LDDETVTESVEEPKRQANQSIVKDEFFDEDEGGQYELEDGDVIPLYAPNNSTSATSKRLKKVPRSITCILLF
jgi:hypothetical protein